ncbi:carbohydrate porin [Rhizorhabdus phycosphaerae]|uniref:carbohydrate porin n=1 Tax=Rhizorhabdus phycosphaerae TaxID=2711156 RepID=UPI0013EBA600|nr:carbohydrate porin [Rhizorhabdus phycosphaerae]
MAIFKKLAVATLLSCIPYGNLHAHDAERAIDISADYTADVVEVLGRRTNHNTYWLDNLNITADADLDRLVGWQGGALHVHVLNNFGGMPNNAAGTLQGVDNIEVPSQRLRLFEAWLEQGIGENTTVRAGLYDLNSEFYANDAAGTLTAPAFGVGSEISATGPNGPSIFPSTALAVRVEHRFDGNGVIRFAAMNAHANTVGDPGGVDFKFHDGLLLIGEAGIERDLELTVGVWAYTRRQDDIYAVDGDGAPLRRKAHGAYVIFEHPLGGQEGPGAAKAFFRAGVSDGRTTPFRGGWQAGITIAQPIASRPDGVFSIGANQGYLSKGYRASLRDGGTRSTAAETALEVTYADMLFGKLGVQPILQLVLDPGGEKSRGPVGVFGMRFSIGF